MIRIALCFIVVALAGCAEVIEGPRYVPVNENRFYYRAGLTAGPDFVDALAQSKCDATGQRAERVTEMQVYPADLRYVTYTCTSS